MIEAELPIVKVSGAAFFAEALMCTILLITCTVRLRLRWLLFTNWELHVGMLLICGSFVYICGNQFVTPALVGVDGVSNFGYSPIESELIMMTTIMAMCFAFSAIVPAKTQVLWLAVPLVAVSVPTATFAIGTGFIFM